MEQSEGHGVVSQTASRLYEDYYSGPNEWRSLGALDKADHIIDLCGSLGARSVIEVGAGEGSVLAELDRRGFGQELHALEIARSGVEAIRNRGIKSLRSAELFDGYRITYPDKSFDLAIATHVLEHVEHERLFLRELTRIARYTMIEVPLESRSFRSLPINNNIGHINFYSISSIEALIATTDLKIVESRVYDHGAAVSKYLGKIFAKRLAAPVRRFANRTLPGLSTHIFVYHYGLLLEPDPASNVGGSALLY